MLIQELSKQVLLLRMEYEAEKEAYLDNYRGQDSEGYDYAFKAVWDAAMQGNDVNEIRKTFRTEYLLTNNEIDKIYLAALKVREAEGVKNYEARKEATANLANVFKQGRFDDSDLKNKNYQITDAGQKVAYEIAKVFSKLGANVRVIYDESIAGLHEADNGFFSSKGNEVTTNTITLTGLTENTLYAWGVKANCTASMSSDWAESAFRTNAVIPPYVGISTADLSSIKVYSHLNNVYIVNENGIAIENVTIYNIFGAQVYTGKANNNPEIISLDVANGNYIVRLSTENGVGVYKLSIVR